MHFDSPTWHANLAALRERNPRLGRRLEAAVPGRHLQAGTSAWRVEHRGAWVDLKGPLPEIPSAPAIGVFGVGDPRLIDAALRATAGPVVAWDRDPTLLRAFLATFDVSERLRDQHLHLALGADLADYLDQATWVVQPELGAIYAWERALLGRPLPARRALVGSGTLFVDDVADALRAEGFAVYPLETSRHTPEELAYTVERIRPEVVFHVNYLHGLAEFCAEHRVPLRVWEIDPATDHVAPVQRPGDAVVYTYRKPHVAEWRARGLASAYLPLAANPERRTPARRSTETSVPQGVAFVGASMVRTASAYLERLVALASARDPNVPRVRATFAAILAEQAQTPTWIADQLLEAVYPGLPAAPHDPALLLGEIAASEHRLNAVARLASLGVEVWGDDGWKLLETRGVRYRGPAGHFHQLNEVYRGALVNVDIGRRYQPDIVTMRVFDVLACGGFVLAADSDALRELFRVGDELDAWATIDELFEKASFYLRNPERARRIAARGRERVLRDHTIAARVQQMVTRGR